MPASSSQKSGNVKPQLTNSGRISRQGKPAVTLISATGQITSPSNSPKAAKGPDNDDHPMADASPEIPTKSPLGPSKPSITSHPLYSKVQSLDPSLKPFLNHDWETNSAYKLTSLKYYNILVHFDPATKARPTKLKNDLVKMFKADLLPHLLPFRVPFSSPPDPEVGDTIADFDPLHRRTTIAMLTSVIQSRNPKVKVSPLALKEEVLVLFKRYVDSNLVLPGPCPFTRTPKIVKSNMLHKLTIIQIRHALQCHQPELFLNLPVMRLQHYVNLYRRFLLEEEIPADEEELVEGYHYWINLDMVESDEMV